jgi:methylated-DNA-[protein]-cysteine S-methyltransferase
MLLTRSDIAKGEMLLLESPVWPASSRAGKLLIGLARVRRLARTLCGWRIRKRSANMSSLIQKQVPSPFGPLRLVATDEALVEVFFPLSRRMPAHEVRSLAKHEILDRAERELAEYFRGERRTFSTPLFPRGTPFQREVWSALESIAYGELCSYAEVAREIGRPRAMRAAGSAIGLNPLPIFIPCHRVIRGDGGMGGFGGGIPTKQWLLAHERRVLSGEAAIAG